MFKIQLDEKQLHDVLFQVLDKKVTFDQLIRQTYPEQWAQKHPKKVLISQSISMTANVIVDEDKHIDYVLCPECNPKA